MIKWGYRKTEKKMLNGVVYKSRPKHNTYLLCKGLHDPIITKEEFDMANEKSKEKTAKSVPKSYKMENPLSGLIKCGCCGRTMVRRPYSDNREPALICQLPHCKTVSSNLFLVENRIIESLKEILKEYKKVVNNYNFSEQNYNLKDNNINIIDDELKKLDKQLNKAYDMLEQEIYDSDTFLKRSSIIKDKIDKLNKEKEKYKIKDKKTKMIQIKEMIPNIETCINEYQNLLTAEDKNKALKKIIDNVVYIKSKGGKGYEDKFRLKITTKLDL